MNCTTMYRMQMWLQTHILSVRVIDTTVSTVLYLVVCVIVRTLTIIQSQDRTSIEWIAGASPERHLLVTVSSKSSFIGFIYDFWTLSFRRRKIQRFFNMSYCDLCCHPCITRYISTFVYCSWGCHSHPSLAPKILDFYVENGENSNISPFYYPRDFRYQK
jgi:hypothetical protein